MLLLDFLMFYEKTKHIFTIIGPEYKEILNKLMCLDIKGPISAQSIRNSFSHDIQIENGVFIIPSLKKEIGFFDWLYISDYLRIITYSLYFELEIQAARQPDNSFTHNDN